MLCNKPFDFLAVNTSSVSSLTTQTLLQTICHPPLGGEEHALYAVYEQITSIAHHYLCCNTLSFLCHPTTASYCMHYYYCLLIHKTVSLAYLLDHLCKNNPLPHYQFNVGTEGRLCGAQDMRVHLCVVFVWLLTPADKFQQSERGLLLRARDRRTVQIVRGKKTPLGSDMKWVLVVQYLITNGL